MHMSIDGHISRPDVPSSPWWILVICPVQLCNSGSTTMMTAFSSRSGVKCYFCWVCKLGRYSLINLLKNSLARICECCQCLQVRISVWPSEVVIHLAVPISKLHWVDISNIGCNMAQWLRVKNQFHLQQYCKENLFREGLWSRTGVESSLH